MHDATGYPDYATLKVSQVAPHILSLELNRPDKLNAMNLDFWRESREFFEALADDPEARAVVLSASGRMFSAGLDLMDASLVDATPGAKSKSEDIARRALVIRRTGKAWQQAFTSIERCGKPVIACVHGGAIGAGVEMLSACDIRFCTRDAYFMAAEVNVGMAADVGGLQRFPKVVGNQSLLRELVFSGRRMPAEEALAMGFVSRQFESKAQMLEAAVELARQIAGKSPVATLGIKELLNHARDHTVDETLDYAITWNMSMLQGKDMRLAAEGFLTKKEPTYPNLPKVGPSKL